MKNTMGPVVHAPFTLEKFASMTDGDHIRVLGVYSKTVDLQSGVGFTSQSQEQKTYWFVRRLDDERYEIQPLNSRHVPSGLRSVISKGQFMSEYVPELDYYERKTVPALKSLRNKLEKGEELFQANQLDEAEKEFSKALIMDEQNPQANLRLGEVYCKNKDYKKLKAALDRVMNTDAVFAEEERHRFNEFGMSLRKNGYHQESIQYYSKALDVNSQDEHLHFNVARVFFEMGNMQACRGHLQKALDIRPDFQEAALFLRHCQQRGASGE